MNQEEQDIRLAEEYIEGKLNPSDMVQMEMRLTRDAAFGKLVNDLKILLHGIRYAAIKSNLQALEASLPEVIIERKTRVIPFIRSNAFRYAMTAAAAITLIIAAAWFFMDSNKSNQELFASYYSPYPNVINAVTRGEEKTPELKDKAFIAYDNRQFDTAIPLFEKLLVEKNDPTISFYAANAYLAEGNTDKAEEKFKHVIKESNEFSIQAKWYLSLCYLKQGKQGEAKKLLEELKNSSTTYSTKAAELINKINS